MSEACRHEPHVLRAANEDRWTDALRDHVKTCQDCAIAALAAPFMRRLARVDERQKKLPDPGVVWLKAQLLAGSAVDDRIARPLNIAQMFSYGVVAAGWAALLTWKWSDLQRWLGTLTPSGVAEGLSGSTAGLSGSVLMMLVVLSTVTVVLAFHTILAEE